MNAEKSSSRRAALVTGGAGGIGAEVARWLARDGYAVVVADLVQQATDAAASALEGTGHCAIAFDVSDPAGVEEGFERAEAVVGPIAVLVHTAGILLNQVGGGHLKFWESSLDRWDRTMSINARGTYIVCAEFMRRRSNAPVHDGRIVLFSSGLAQSVSSNRTYADYSASKAAVLGFMRAAARDCAGFGVTVNTIAPGLTETPMLRQNFVPGTVPLDPNIVPLGRLGTPADIAAMVRFIASPESGYITGATFDVNGGGLMR